ncbi:MAG: gamma-glutamyl-gamma-aminobutyrate hydrolase family protein [Bacteroidia bacterium]
MKKTSLLGLLLFIFCLISELPAQTILISKDKNKEIRDWVLWQNPSAKIVEFYYLNPDSQLLLINQATHIIIGGGEDIQDKIYGGSEFPQLCGKFNPYRDSIEIGLIQFAIQKKIPLLGICRGLQLMNASCGGTLLADIDSLMHSPIQHMQVGKDSAHAIEFTPLSLFQKKFHLQKSFVNSTHHQCIKKLSPLFFTAALAPDGIIEAIQIKNKKQFALAVQWHPERLQNKSSLLLLKEFLK